MEKTYFFKLVAIAIIGLAIFAFIRSISDDDDPVYDLLCIHNIGFSYLGLFVDVLAPKSAFYQSPKAAIRIEPITSFIAMQEKSPPRIVPAIIP